MRSFVKGKEKKKFFEGFQEILASSKTSKKCSAVPVVQCDGGGEYVRSAKFFLAHPDKRELHSVYIFRPNRVSLLRDYVEPGIN